MSALYIICEIKLKKFDMCLGALISLGCVKDITLTKIAALNMKHSFFKKRLNLENLKIAKQ